ncbi:methylglyoxal reductase (NADPH-dependent) gre2 [Maudiozyma exigua]|uniref:Methylglyoxal reductase (NADPH-dependent) gre2 n=1 Tax=Maudiozyma exigua TaxID=34358 RepID=A0A9P6VVB5_MAUEX|nr:methylglyoxal reductase (NADPH-dependent) gre2 [Kazachstania exigua]
MSVFISGATGFIAKHIIQQLLEQNYKVIGSARSEAKCVDLKQKFNNNPNLYMVVVPDISELDAFDEAFDIHGSEVKYVLHTASPFTFDVTDFEKDLLIPARNGTLGILRSIKKFSSSTVERFVITSSFAAMFDLHNLDNDNITFNEESWNPDDWNSCQRNARAAYCGSKKVAEETAWNFYDNYKSLLKLEMTSVNAVCVFGPQMFDSDVANHLNTSCEYINSALHSTTDKFPPYVSGRYIDVRDVAKAHIYAFQKENTIGKRLILSEGNFNTQDILNYLNEDFSVLKGRICVGTPNDGVEHSSFGAKTDNHKTKEVLGFKFIDLKQTVDDTAVQILKHEGRL